MTEPTDKELIALRQECRADPRCEEEHWFILFARAVLAKWGVSRAEKIVIPTDTMEQEFQKHYRRGYEAGKKVTAPQPTQAQAGAVPAFYTAFAKFEGAPIPLAQYSASSETGVLERVMDVARKEGYTGRPQARMTELGWVVGPVYAAPQELAMERVPLTDQQIDQAIAELGLNYIADAHTTNRAVLRHLCRRAHGIKGGQHGAE